MTEQEAHNLLTKINEIQQLLDDEKFSLASCRLDILSAAIQLQQLILEEPNE